LNLLPYWLTRYRDHPLASLPIAEAAMALRGYAVAGDEMARKVFAQQARALANLFTISARFTDPHAYFVGGGVVEASKEFRDWFMSEVTSHVLLMDEQKDVVEIALVPDLDMAGARGVAVAARNEVGLGRG
jgi:predicted NBD/HSP70 family sugar kinase